MPLDRLISSSLRIAQRLVNARALLFEAYDPQITEIIRRVRPYTMTSAARVAALCDAVTYVVKHDIPGSFVECGVWKGGSSMAMALRLLQLGRSDRDLYLFDTYEGMTAPTEADRSGTSGFAAATLLKSAPAKSKIAALAPLEEVRRNLALTRYPSELTHFIKGPVEETLTACGIGPIAVLRLDTDWYASTKHELACLFPSLSTGGVLILDDYGDWEGARRAADEYFGEAGVRIFLHRIDHTGRIAIKQ
jgi:O-methyltransferase